MSDLSDILEQIAKKHFNIIDYCDLSDEIVSFVEESLLVNVFDVIDKFDDYKEAVNETIGMLDLVYDKWLDTIYGFYFDNFEDAMDFLKRNDQSFYKKISKTADFTYKERNDIITKANELLYNLAISELNYFFNDVYNEVQNILTEYF